VYIYLKNYYLICTGIIAFCLLNSCQIISNGDSDDSMADNISKEQYVEPQVVNTIVASDEPLVATVNTVSISEKRYKRELLRYEAALRNSEVIAPNIEKHFYDVLEQLILSELIGQAAREQGFTVTEQQLDEAYADSISARGGQAGFDKWLEDNIYTEVEFQSQLEEQLLATKIQELVLNDVGTYAEQVNARHIVVATREQAEDLRSKIVAGADFATIAAIHSLDRSTRLNGGDLGWLPRGLLTMPVLEAEVFDLEPGELGDIVETEIGFHIIQNIDRNMQRELTPNAAVVVRRAVLDSWLADLRSQAVIEKFVQ
jgi:parvulin-like peptidyl-prolyl isomerase